MVSRRRVFLTEGHDNRRRRHIGPGTGRVPVRHSEIGGRLGSYLQQKQSVVRGSAKQVAGAQAIVLAENRGMAVAHMTQLRAKARLSGVYFRWSRTPWCARAVVDTPFASLADRMVGPAAYALVPTRGRGESAERLRQEPREVLITGAPCRARYVRRRTSRRWRRCHTREELIGKLLGTMQAPMAKARTHLSEVRGVRAHARPASATRTGA